MTVGVTKYHIGPAAVFADACAFSGPGKQPPKNKGGRGIFGCETARGSGSDENTATKKPPKNHHAGGAPGQQPALTPGFEIAVDPCTLEFAAS